MRQGHKSGVEIGARAWRWRTFAYDFFNRQYDLLDFVATDRKQTVATDSNRQ
jgi:hypothetical protein